MPVGDGVSPDPGFACPFEASFDGRLTLSHLIDVVLFASKPPAPSAGAGGDDAAGVPAHVQRLLLDEGAHQNSGCMRGGFVCIARRINWVANAHAGFFDAVGQRLAPFWVYVLHPNIHERWKKALSDGSFQWLKISSDVGADAGGILPLALQAECEFCVGSLRVVHRHFGQ